ncbi:GNAT family N-acetyltransferase [Brevibacillus fluminis]|uniref:GNAT family N-acetyltransferase n=1 Tax=Brevibacillus fluminis TaxID=511487 RepID=UPI001FEA0B29|nr:GNAT family N-acetyltransferase [Brevibacillus fluminis]
MVTIKKLSECTFLQAVEAWNKGFEGYFFDATTTVDRFITRFAYEGLSSDLSIVAFHDDQPVGLILSGVRTIDGKKVAWNGGTGVASAYRKQGVGREMMKALMALYEEAGIDVAILEAFRQNEKAIALYQQMGYEIIDQLLFLQNTEAFETNPFADAKKLPFTVKHGIPQDVRHLSFSDTLHPWQTQWQGVRDGESLIVLNADGQEVGYAIYKRSFDESGKPLQVSLLQCEVRPGHVQADDIVRLALSHAFAPWDVACKRTTFNLPASKERVVQSLASAGFTPSMEQVYMRKER